MVISNNLALKLPSSPGQLLNWEMTFARVIDSFSATLVKIARLGNLLLWNCLFSFLNYFSGNGGFRKAHRLFLTRDCFPRLTDPTIIGDIRKRTVLNIEPSLPNHFSSPCCATAMLSRLEFLTMYIISSAWRMISWELLASSG